MKSTSRDIPAREVNQVNCGSFSHLLTRAGSRLLYQIDDNDGVRPRRRLVHIGGGDTPISSALIDLLLDLCVVRDQKRLQAFGCAYDTNQSIGRSHQLGVSHTVKAFCRVLSDFEPFLFTLGFAISDGARLRVKQVLHDLVVNLEHRERDLHFVAVTLPVLYCLIDFFAKSRNNAWKGLTIDSSLVMHITCRVEMAREG